MTNWMTAAGIALIAGGLATLICFRSVLFGRASSRGAQPAVEAAPRSRRGSRRRQPTRGQPLELVGAPVGSVSAGPADIELGDLDEDERRPGGGLALIGFGGDEEPSGDVVNSPEPERPAEPEDREEIAEIEEIEEIEAIEEEPEVEGRRHQGHRVDGWVRPEYQEIPPPTGDYWTPIPEHREPSAQGYGWPVQVERLPPVPSYEPATGFDLTPVPAEPTEAITTWPRDKQIRLPRSWSTRDENGPQRPRPRPRPRPSQSDNGYYVSRHAADPPR